MWAALEEALASGRPRDALRLAVILWRDHRDMALADLVDALAAFVDSDPRTASAAPPADPADMDGWLARLDDSARRIFAGEYWTRDWQADALDLLRQLERAEDPRVATALLDFLLDRRFVRDFDDLTVRFVTRLVALRDERARRRLAEFVAAAPPGSGFARHLRSAATDGIGREPPLEEEAAAIVARGLARYRDEPQRLVDLVLDPERERDDGTEQVTSDALSEMGHPYGEAIALQYDAAAGIITAAGRERLATLLACHERRWLGRALFRSTTERVYRGGMLDRLVLLTKAEDDVLLDRRLARLRVLRAEPGEWGTREAAMLGESPWLGALEELDVPSFEMLAAMTRQSYPRLRRIRLGRLRPVRFNEDWNDWAEPLAAFCARLPELREVVFRTIPEDGLEALIEALLAAGLHDRIETLSLDGSGWSWVPRGERDVTMWFRLLDPHGVRRAALYYTDAAMTVEWVDRELAVTLETKDGGAAFDLLRRLPERAVARLVLRDLPGRRARKLGGLGRLRREIERLGPREVDMPTRWKNLLAAVPKE